MLQICSENVNAIIWLYMLRAELGVLLFNCAFGLVEFDGLWEKGFMDALIELFFCFICSIICGRGRVNLVLPVSTTILSREVVLLVPCH